MTSREILDQLNSIKNASDFDEESGRLTAAWATNPDRIVFMDTILHFMEENPNLDYGMPGPLVHFMEEIEEPEYAVILSESIERMPIFQNVWMMNRLLNGMTSNEQKRNLLAVLKRASNNVNVDENTVRQIRRFIGIHE